jgi:pyruvate/2-oxoglutarate dehydrogenase complex dihydrolipoamide dehydrogenase (E3) component
MTKPYDLVVVGGGAAGLVAAHTAITVGASVVLVEANKMGGDCLWRGCVPSKSLIAAGKAAAHAREAHRLGIHVAGVSVDFPAVMDHVHRSIRAIQPTDSAETISELGVKVMHGQAAFVSDESLMVGGTSLPYRQVLLATGSAPAVPDIPGLARINYLTSETLWELTELPEQLVIIGAGNVGCELGQAFARLGADVTLIESGPQILPGTDPDAADLVAQALAADGVDIQLNSVPVAASGMGDSGTVTSNTGRGTRDFGFSRLLVAAGRQARTHHLGLEHVAVRKTKAGSIAVNENLRTSNPRIWAAGDATDFPHFTHLAGMNALAATLNALLGLRRKALGARVPRVTFTDPEVASVGRFETGRGTGLAVKDRVMSLDNSHVDRAIAEADTVGFTKLTLDNKSRIVGAVIVGPRAGESLSELSLAITKGLKTRHLADQIHPYPTYSDGPWNAAIQDTQERLDSPTVKRITRVVATFRRRPLDRISKKARRAAQHPSSRP